jgi:hypothetical protein
MSGGFGRGTKDDPPVSILPTAHLAASDNLSSWFDEDANCKHTTVKLSTKNMS